MKRNNILAIYNLVSILLIFIFVFAAFSSLSIAPYVLAAWLFTEFAFAMWGTKNGIYYIPKGDLFEKVEGDRAVRLAKRWRIIFFLLFVTVCIYIIHNIY